MFIFDQDIKALRTIELNKTRLSFTIDRVSHQHVSIRVTQIHLRPNQRKLAKHDKKKKINNIIKKINR